MRDILLQCSGLLAIAAAVTHGVLTETKVFPQVTIEPQQLRTLFRLVLADPDGRFDRLRRALDRGTFDSVGNEPGTG